IPLRRRSLAGRAGAKRSAGPARPAGGVRRHLQRAAERERQALLRRQAAAEQPPWPSIAELRAGVGMEAWTPLSNGLGAIRRVVYASKPGSRRLHNEIRYLVRFFCSSASMAYTPLA